MRGSPTAPPAGTLNIRLTRLGDLLLVALEHEAAHAAPPSLKNGAGVVARPPYST